MRATARDWASSPPILTTSGKISLFVANDVVENFYFYNETPAPGEPIKLVEQALVRGLAFAADGQAQASMGVADR